MREDNPAFMDHELVQAQALAANPALFTFDDMIIEGNAKPKKRAKRRSIISRVISLLAK